MPEIIPTQKDRLLEHLTGHGLARALELLAIGVSRTAIARARADGEIVRIGRGLYRLADAELDADAALAEVSKQAPKSVICLTSALAFHGLTDQIPRRIWIAIGAHDWAPRIKYPPVRIVRFREPYYSHDIETHKIGAVEVPVYSVTKSIADAIRNPGLVNRSVGIEAIKSAIAERKATPCALAQAGRTYRGARIIESYLEAMTSSG